MGRTSQVHQRASSVEWRVAAGSVRLTPLVGDPVELTGAAAAVWAVLDLPRTEDEVYSEALQIEPLFERAEVSQALHDLVAAGHVWRSASAAGRRDIAI